MPAPRPRVVVVIAEDDDDDFLLTREAFAGASVANELVRVKDGDELLDFLLRRNAHRDRPPNDPILVLLDLNMPRKDGREALREIKSNAALRSIPVVTLTTSRLEDDIARSYQLGANSFIRKPLRLDQFVDVVRALKRYWLEVVEIPSSQT